MLNLDTHILINALVDSLNKQERAILEKERWSVSAIVQWEICKLAQLGRIELDLNSPDLLRVFQSIHIWPISFEISRMSTELDIESDPADEIIAATSIIHRIPLLTRDKVLKSSTMIPLATNLKKVTS